MPYDTFSASLSCLDPRRLGKQRVEAKQILNVLEGRSFAWRNHPAVKMWRGYEDALGLYMNECIKEWKRRGYKNTMALYEGRSPSSLPPFMGLEVFHASHRSNLLRKDPFFYSRYGWSESDDMAYYWPSDKDFY